MQKWCIFVLSKTQNKLEMENIVKVIEQQVEKINAENWAFDMQFTIWKEKRAYFKRPGVSRKYQDVGYIDLTTFKTFPMNIPAISFKARTSDEKKYADVLSDISDALLGTLQL